MRRDTRTGTEASADEHQPGTTQQPAAPAATRRRFLQTVGAGALATTAVASPATGQAASAPFVETDGTDLVMDGETVYFHGANNFWITDSYRGEPERIDSLFAQFEEMGIDLVRTFVACEGGDGDCYIPEPYEHSEGAYETLDYLIASAAEHGIRLVLVLSDNWDHNGGAAQYVEWTDGASVHGDFFANEDVRDLYRWHVEETLTRENTVTGLEYREDPTIAFWELCNEPRVEGDAFGEGEDPGYEERAGILEDWLTEMSQFVTDLDPNHLISTGMEGFYTRDDRTEWFYNEWTGQNYLRHHDVDTIDVCTFHWYPYHWNIPLEYGATWIEEHVRDAHETLGKPAYMGEFNVNRTHGLETRNEYLAEWYEAADAYDCDAATIWQIVLEEMHDHDGFQVYRSESGDVLGAYREAVAAKRETAVGGDSELSLAPPNSLRATTTGSAIDVHWSAVDAASEYVVSLDGSQVERTASTGVHLDGLDSETDYEVGVAAVGSGGDESAAATTIATTEGPSTVDAPAWEYGTAYEDGDSVVHNGIVWNAQWYTDEEEPRFESGFAWAFDRIVASPLGPTGDDGGEQPGTPSTPADAWTTDVGEREVALAWDAVDDADRYAVFLDGVQVETSESTATTLDGLEPATTYTIGVAASNDAGESGTATTTMTTEDGGEPGDPCEAAGAAEGETLADGSTVCDVDGDGAYMDVTGDGSVTNSDVTEFFGNQHADPWDSRADLFDFTGDDDVTQADVIELFAQL